MTPPSTAAQVHRPMKETDRFDLVYDWEGHRRFIAGTSVIIHCHHYNARIQNTIESAHGFDGRGLFREVAQNVFQRALERAVGDEETAAERLRVAEQLYAEYGYGLLALGDGAVVTAPVSHFVEGWRVGFPQTSRPVCSLTEGFTQAAIQVATGRTVDVREVACMLEGAAECQFSVSTAEPRVAVPSLEVLAPASVSSPPPFVRSPRIDEEAIIRAVVGMSIRGDDEGLIPAFNVYLANTPAEFYSEVCVRFVEEMDRLRQRRIASQLLTFDAETCGLNTFRGIRASAEWEALVAPMVAEVSDELFGMIAISNSLGWGNWHPTQHTPGESLRLWTSNGYEALGYRALRKPSNRPGCFMLTGVAAGLLELFYGEGSVIERFGQFASREKECVCCGSGGCLFEVTRA